VWFTFLTQDRDLAFDTRLMFCSQNSAIASDTFVSLISWVPEHFPLLLRSRRLAMLVCTVCQSLFPNY